MANLLSVLDYPTCLACLILFSKRKVLNYGKVKHFNRKLVKLKLFRPTGRNEKIQNDIICTVSCGVVLYDMVLYDMVLYGMVQYGLNKVMQLTSYTLILEYICKYSSAFWCIFVMIQKF